MATVEELMALRAPNTSGVDTKAYLQGISRGVGNTPTTYAYGLRPEEVQKEAAATAQMQAQRMQNLTDATQLAMAQDKQLYDRAMQAYNVSLAERNQKFQQEVARAELGLRQAASAREAERFKLDAQILQNKIDGMKALDGIQVKIPNLNAGRIKRGPDGNPMLGPDGRAIVEEADNYLPATAAIAAGIDLSKVLGVSNSPQERMAAQKAKSYQAMGIPTDDANLMALFPLDRMLESVNKNVSADLKAAKDVSGTGSYGEIETGEVDKRGRPIKRAKTQEEYANERRQYYLDTQFSMLSKEARDILTRNFGLDGSSLKVEEASTDPLSSLDLNALAPILLEALK